MEKKRKIALVVNKVTANEMDADENIYWSMQSETDRFKELIRLRKTFFKSQDRIQKVVFKGSLEGKRVH